MEDHSKFKARSNCNLWWPFLEQPTPTSQKLWHQPETIRTAFQDNAALLHLPIGGACDNSVQGVSTNTEVRSASARLFAGMWRPLVSVITTLLLCCDYFTSSRVVSRTFSALCVYSKFRHHPHLTGYLCAKFCFFRSLHC